VRERLAVAHENYARQGWAVGELHSGQWAFMATKGARQLLIAIRDLASVSGATHATRGVPKLP